MKIDALPAFTDNYDCMVHDGARTWGIGPGAAMPMHSALDTQGLALAAILVTHHHVGHVGGVDAQCERLGGRVFGPPRDVIACLFRTFGSAFEVPDAPGHIAGLIACLQRPPGGGSLWAA